MFNTINKDNYFVLKDLYDIKCTFLTVALEASLTSHKTEKKIITWSLRLKPKW